MSRPAEKFVVRELRETYHELGEYEFKVVLNPRFFENGHGSELKVVDSDGRPLEHSSEVWGRKVSCRFKIDESVADGVSAVDLSLRSNGTGEPHRVRLFFWVIK